MLHLQPTESYLALTMNDSGRLTFIKAGEINGISPLPHFYEEIYPNQQGLKKLGIRGDRNYLLYSYDGHGTMYYEAHEMELAAQSTFEHFQVAENRKAFFEGIDDILQRASEWTRRVDGLDFTSHTNQELASLFLKANQFHGEIFTYYVVSQPYRIKNFEAAIRAELEKRVAKSRVDHYMTILAASEKTTRVTEEAIDWLELLIAHCEAGPVEIESVESTHPELWSAIQAHYEKYKVLTLGDGNWRYDINYFLHNLVADIKTSSEELESKLKKLKSQPQQVAATKKRLIEELYLDEGTVTMLEFLAEVGHTRFVMRTDGWIPHVHSVIQLDTQLSIRLGYEGNILNFMSEQELQLLADEWQLMNREIIDQRIGKHAEFILLNQDGQYRLIFGEEAGRLYKELVPPIDHAATEQLRGTTAVIGKITDRVCVYNWGDDLAEKIAVIKKFPILVTGQTRPSMMPIIRLAKGIVTDEGGVTSHAAIVSRELGIPSVIGTTHATKTFKDGDMVELDADMGIVRRAS